MPKFSREQFKYLIFMLSGGILVLISLLLIASAIMRSGFAIVIAILLIGGIGLGYYGFKKFKESRYY